MLDTLKDKVSFKKKSLVKFFNKTISAFLVVSFLVSQTAVFAAQERRQSSQNAIPEAGPNFENRVRALIERQKQLQVLEEGNKARAGQNNNPSENTPPAGPNDPGNPPTPPTPPDNPPPAPDNDSPNKPNNDPQDPNDPNNPADDPTDPDDNPPDDPQDDSQDKPIDQPDGSDAPPQSPSDPVQYAESTSTIGMSATELAETLVDLIDASVNSLIIRELFVSVLGITLPPSGTPLDPVTVGLLADTILYASDGTPNNPSSIFVAYNGVAALKAEVGAGGSVVNDYFVALYAVDFSDGINPAEFSYLLDVSGLVIDSFPTSSLDTDLLDAFGDNQDLSPLGIPDSFPDAIDALADQASTYDLSILAIEFLKRGDFERAGLIFDFLYGEYETQVAAGGFSGFSIFYNTLTGLPGIDTAKRVGENAFVALAALHDYFATGDARMLELALAVATWIASLPTSGGGIAQGATPPLSTIFSTENNIDAWKLFDALIGIDAVSAGDKALFASKMAGIETWLMTEAFRPAAGLFGRGDSTDLLAALDANTFAILALGPEKLIAMGIDIEDLIAAIEATFLVQPDGSFGGGIFTAMGFDFSDAVNAALIGRLGIKWVEGTHQMVLVYRLLADYYTELGDMSKAAGYSAKADYFFGLNTDNDITGVGGKVLGHTQASDFGVGIFADSSDTTALARALAASIWTLFSEGDYRLNPFEIGSSSFIKDAVAVVDAVSRVGSLRASLSAAGLLDEFDLLFGTTLVSGVSPVPATELVALFALVFSPTYFESVLVGGIPDAYDLLIALQSDAATRADFELVFGVTVPASGTPPAVVTGLLFDITAATGYDEAVFLVETGEVASLYSFLLADPTALALVNTTFSIVPPIVLGVPLTETQRSFLYGVTGSPFYTTPEAFIDSLTGATGLFAAILAAGTLALDSFNRLFDPDIVAGSTVPTEAQLTVLSGIVGGPFYTDASTFIAETIEAADLLTYLDTTPSALALVNSTFLATILTPFVAGATPTDAQREFLYAVVGGALYTTPEAFIESLLSGISEAAEALLSALFEDPARVTAFNALFGTSLTPKGAVTSEDSAVLNGLVGDPDFSMKAFLRYLVPAYSLLVALRASAGLLADFNMVFDAGLAASGEVSTLAREILFGIVAGALYLESEFLRVLSIVADLLGLFIFVPGFLADFNFFYATDIVVGVPLSPENIAVLFGVGAFKGFSLASFPTTLGLAVDLLLALRASPKMLLMFNALFGTTIGLTGPLTAAMREALLATASGTGFSVTGFLSILPDAYDLVTALRAKPRLLGMFNGFFGTSISSTGAVGTALGLIFGIVGDSAFVLSEFLRVLPIAVSLVAALRAAGLVPGFNSLYGTTLSLVGPVGLGNVATIFGIAGPIGFSVKLFVTLLPAVISLVKVLRATPGASAAFTTVFGLPIPTSGPLSPEVLGALFGIVGPATYPGASIFVSGLIAAALLSTTLTSLGLVPAFTTLFGPMTPAALFGIVFGPLYPGASIFATALPLAATLYTTLVSMGLLDEYYELVGLTPTLAVSPLPPPALVAALFSTVSTVGYSLPALLALLLGTPTIISLVS